MLWNLRLLRTHAGLSQRALARAAGVSQTRVSDLELGIRPIGAEVEQLAHALAVDEHILRARAITIAHTGNVSGAT